MFPSGFLIFQSVEMLLFLLERRVWVVLEVETPDPHLRERDPLPRRRRRTLPHVVVVVVVDAVAAVLVDVVVVEEEEGEEGEEEEEEEGEEAEEVNYSIHHR